MTSWEIIVILAGIPVGTMTLLGLLTLGPSALRRRPVYRPGDEWDHPPVWWTANSSLQQHNSGHHDTEDHDTEDHDTGGHDTGDRGAARHGHGGARGDW